MPVKVLVFALLIVKLRVVLLWSGMLAAPKVWVTVGGTVTLRLADAVLPVPPLVEVTVPVVLVQSPPAAPVTFNVMVHDAPVAIFAPDKLTLLDPAVALTVPAVHEFVSPLEFATTIPAGKASVKATPVRPATFAPGLVIVKLRVVFPFSGMRGAPKDFVMEGGSSTATLA